MSITVIRPGTRILTPGLRGVRITQPMGGAAIPWYLSGGVAASACIAAYQPKGAASLAASYVNLANPGTYDATPGVAPAFDAATGWTFDGASKYLKTGVVLARAAGSFIVRFSGAATALPSKGPAILGSYQGGACALGLAGNSWFGGTSVWCANGQEVQDSPAMVSGILSMAGVSLYRNGVYDSDKSAGSGTNTTAVFIGALNQYGSPVSWSYFNGAIQALALYDAILTAPQVAAVSAAIAAI